MTGPVPMRPSSFPSTVEAMGLKATSYVGEGVERVQQILQPLEPLQTKTGELPRAYVKLLGDVLALRVILILM